MLGSEIQADCPALSIWRVELPLQETAQQEQRMQKETVSVLQEGPREAREATEHSAGLSLVKQSGRQVGWK